MPPPAYFAEDPLEDIVHMSSTSIIEALKEVLDQAESNSSSFAIKLADAKSTLETEYKNFYDDALKAYIKGIADDAEMIVRPEYRDSDSLHGQDQDPKDRAQRGSHRDEKDD